MQFISLVVSPINSRLYTPSDYGVLSVFGACFSVLSIIATMRYEGALPIAEDDVEGIHILLLGFIVTVFWTLVTILITLILGERIAIGLLSNIGFYHYLWFLPLGLFLVSIYNVLSAWASRKHEFKKLSALRIYQSIFGSGSTVVLGIFKFELLGLIIGTLISYLTILPNLFIGAFRDIKCHWKSIKLEGILKVARIYYRFPFYNTWGLLLNSFSSQLPIFAMSAAFGIASSGYFSFSQRILLMPTLLISGAIAPVFYAKAKEAYKNGTLTSFTRRMLESLVGMNAFFIMFIVFFGEVFFSIVFGVNWTRAGTYSMALAPWLLLNFLVTPLATLPLVFGRQGTDLLFHVMLLVVRTSAFLIGFNFKSDMVSMIAYGFGSAVFMLVYMAWLLKMVDILMFPLVIKIFRELFLASILLGACRLLMWWSDNNLILTLFALIPVTTYFLFRVIKQFKSSRSMVQAG